MKANVGGMDRVIRAILGIVLLAVGIFAVAGTWQWVSIVVGAILVLTSLVSFCPLYAVLKLNTCKSEAAEKTA